MDEEVLSVLSTGQVLIEYRGGEFGELVSIYNLPGNTNRVFFRVNGDTSTSEAAISPDNYSPPILLDPKRNQSGINIIAETGTTSVRVFRTPFRGRLERLVAQVGLWAGLAASYWRAISGTVIALKGAYVQANMDVIKSKTFTATAGSIDLSTNAQVALLSPDGTDYIVEKNGGTYVTSNNAARHAIEDAQVSVFNIPQVLYAAVTQTDPRHTITTGAHVLHTPVAGGGVEGVGIEFEFPIVNGVTMSVGDLAAMSATPNRITQTGTVPTKPVIGIITVGGTGNAGGTVFGRAKVFGLMIAPVLADAAGVTINQHAKQGTTTANNRVESQATLADGTFAWVMTTAASGVATNLFIGGGRA